MNWFEWIAVFELPALAGLLVLVLKLRDDLSATQIKLAETRITTEMLSTLRDEILRHLERIETRIDNLTNNKLGAT